MKKLFFIFFCTFCCINLELDAQSIRNVELISERTSKSGIDIYAKTHSLGGYTVFIQFNKLENTHQGNTYSTVVNESGKILSLNPVFEGKPVICNYRYYYIRGYKPRKLDSAFVYRLPFSTEKTEPVKALTLYNVNQRHFGDSTDNNWISWQFILNQGDTVLAVRKGMVVEIVDEYDSLDDKSGVSFSSNRNSITIEHSDGTLSNYQVLEKGSCIVSIGDVVYPGTPLGKVGTYSKNDNYQVRILISYPDIDKTLSENPSSNKSVFKNVYYNPFFLTSEGIQQLERGKSYNAISSKELVQKEMTKKELNQK